MHVNVWHYNTPQSVCCSVSILNIGLLLCGFFFKELSVVAWRVVSRHIKILRNPACNGRRYMLDLSNQLHLFCVHYTILPRLKLDLKCFIGSWNNHPIRTEANLTPNQLWHIGMLQTPVADPDVEVFFNHIFNVICI